MKKSLVFFILLFLTLSCGAQEREVVRRSTIRLEGKNTNIRHSLDIDGYYTRDGKVTSSSSDNIIFFEDGTYVWQFSFKKGTTVDSIRENLSESIDTWLESKQIRWGYAWGVYRIEGDIIIGNIFLNHHL